MGVAIQYVDALPECGLYIYDERLVLIRKGLSPVMLRSTLAHEAAHAEMGHQQQDDFCKMMMQERMASAMAARRLVNFWDFTLLMDLEASEKEMCDRLAIARPLLRAYMWLTAPAWQLAA
jgi:hypothetical protein